MRDIEEWRGRYGKLEISVSNVSGL